MIYFKNFKTTKYQSKCARLIPLGTTFRGKFKTFSGKEFSGSVYTGIGSPLSMWNTQYTEKEYLIIDEYEPVNLDIAIKEIN